MALKTPSASVSPPPGVGARLFARRRTRLAQAGAVVLLLGAVTLLALPVADMLKPAAPRLESTTPSTSAQPGQAAHEIDITGSARVLAVLNPRVEREPPATAAPSPTAPDKPEPAASATESAAPPPSTDWAYLGSIVSPKSVFALVRAGGSGEQILMAVNETREGRTLEEVYPDHIILSDAAGLYYRVDLLPPTQVWPEYGPGRLAGAAVAKGGAAGPGTAGSARSVPTAIKTAAKSGAARPNWGSSSGPSGIVTSVSSAPGTRPPSDPPVPDWASRLPPGVDYKTVDADALAKMGIDPNNPQPNGPRPRDDYDPVELETLMRKVEANDYDAEWVSTTIESMGLPRDSTFEEKVGFFGQLGITPQNNLEFIKKVEEITGGNKRASDRERAEREAAQRENGQ